MNGEENKRVGRLSMKVLRERREKRSRSEKSRKKCRKKRKKGIMKRPGEMSDCFTSKTKNLFILILKKCKVKEMLKVRWISKKSSFNGCKRNRR